MGLVEAGKEFIILYLYANNRYVIVCFVIQYASVLSIVLSIIHQTLQAK